MSCYGEKKHSCGGDLIRIFEENNISVSDISVRTEILYEDFENESVTLECISAWSPPYEAYSRLAGHFGINFVLQAEEPGFSVYINTDTNKKYFAAKYKVYLAKRPENHSMDNLFDNAGGDSDFYFDSDEELMEWFRKGGTYNAETVEELKEYLDEEYICIYEFENPYR